jgi:nucleoside-diphosphate-sugar epimerase
MPHKSLRYSGEIRDARMVLHLAAQVAVTTSVKDPRHDFEVKPR